MKKLPVYELTISQLDEGIEFISLVDEPATESNFLAFKEQEVPMKFSVEDEDERIIYGVLMRADHLIPRYDENIGMYYVKFSKDTLKVMAEKLLLDNKQSAVNIMHQEGSEVEGVSLVQIFIKDVEGGIDPKGFEDIEDGSLFASFKVDNDNVWKAVKDGTFKGFSIEGVWHQEEVSMITKYAKQKSRTNMAKLKEKLKKLLAEFASITTDKGELFYEGEELVVGVEVYDENDNPIEDGEYAYEEKIIVVRDGKVEEIREKEVEEETKVEDFKAVRFSKVKALFEESYDERYAKIYQAVSEAGYVDAYIVEAGDTYAVIDVYDENGERLIKFDLTWDEEGNVTVSNPTEVEIEYEPVEEAQVEEEKKEEFAEEEEVVEETVEETTVKEDNTEERLAAVEDSIKDIYDKIDELRDALEKISNEPAAEPIAEEFASVTAEAGNTGNEKFDRLYRIASAQKK